MKVKTYITAIIDEDTQMEASTYYSSTMWAWVQLGEGLGLTLEFESRRDVQRLHRIMGNLLEEKVVE